MKGRGARRREGRRRRVEEEMEVEQGGGRVEGGVMGSHRIGRGGKEEGEEVTQVFVV